MIRHLLLFLSLFLLLIVSPQKLQAQSVNELPKVVQVEEDSNGALSSVKGRSVSSPADSSAENESSMPIPINQQAISKRPNVVTQAAAITLMSLLPYIVILLTSFLKSLSFYLFLEMQSECSNHLQTKF